MICIISWDFILFWNVFLSQAIRCYSEFNWTELLMWSWLTYRFPLCNKTFTAPPVSLSAEWLAVYLGSVRLVGILRRSRSSSLSWRLQCRALSFFTSPPTLQWKRRGRVCVCVFVWKAHLADKTCNPTLSPTDLNPRLLSLPSHLRPSPSPQALRGEMDLCLLVGDVNWDLEFRLD